MYLTASRRKPRTPVVSINQYDDAPHEDEQDTGHGRHGCEGIDDGFGCVEQRDRGEQEGAGDGQGHTQDRKAHV